jgi:hypothetical protein
MWPITSQAVRKQYAAPNAACWWWPSASADQYYADFGPTLAAEKLGERHDVRASRETLRGWMRQAGIWLPRAERKRVQQPRHRREHFGELIQIDGSDHRWFEDRGAPARISCSLMTPPAD